MIFRATHLHLKSGKTVKVIGRGRAEADLTAVVGYVEADGTFWVRDAAVFDDGRFKLLDPPMVTAFAWVIEDGKSKTERPLYFSGVDTMGRFQWSFENARAVRFVRQQDAEAVAKADRPNSFHRVAEHGWEELEGEAAGDFGPVPGDGERSADQTA